MASSTAAALVIREPGKNDGLGGRGRAIRLHEGNQRFIRLINGMRLEYESAPKGRKMDVVRRVVDTIHNEHGRFLQKKGSAWEEAGLEKAIIKTSQAFRDLRVEESATAKKSVQPTKHKQFDYSLLKKHAPAGRFAALLNDSKNKNAVSDETDNSSSASSSEDEDSGSDNDDSSKSGSEESSSSSEEERDHEGDISETETEDSFPVYRGPKSK